ncbi:hypothetical protein Mp_5g01920 [Marchantia polymorpha subsp. ruderalis]|uniref:STM1-like N-terminal domain-containing protein n=2 Tax=Marchantia polymorpha TaxID=3197 RepID=A0AAF6BDY4_MARPO|nr:hypothetical protein MARPO_0161s0012 [Marchantia polymorpha]BBN10218.1 hypothetical protein Mp_5g01920 [Marchantia polymorpha subsp. ruderalis]|eukprot:PTQ28509.1 hypothetical protein MARPO_0161s0012 [Marchantia polymorpha]
MSLTNYFDLLGDDENEESTTIIAKATQTPLAEKPATKKSKPTPVVAHATARLPSKPTPLVEAVKEQIALNESGRGRGEGRATGFQRENRNYFSRDRRNYTARSNNRWNSDAHQGGNRVDYVVGEKDGGFGGGVNERATREEYGKNWSFEDSRSRGRGGCGRGSRDCGYGGDVEDRRGHH